MNEADLKGYVLKPDKRPRKNIITTCQVITVDMSFFSS